MRHANGGWDWRRILGVALLLVGAALVFLSRLGNRAPFQEFLSGLLLGLGLGAAVLGLFFLLRTLPWK